MQILHLKKLPKSFKNSLSPPQKLFKTCFEMRNRIIMFYPKVINFLEGSSGCSCARELHKIEHFDIIEIPVGLHSANFTTITRANRGFTTFCWLTMTLGKI